MDEQDNEPKSEMDVKVNIPNDLRRGLPFGKLMSRNGTAIVMCYYGDTEEVIELLQKTSHAS